MHIRHLGNREKEREFLEESTEAVLHTL